jgi:parvulin-like peptidyl-prolyl isomerase
MEDRMKLSTLFSIALAGLVVSAGSAGAQPKAAAYVNGEVIPASDLDAVLNNSQPPSPTPLTADQKKEMRAAALNLLIEDTLMRQFLRQQPLDVTSQEIDKDLQELIAELAKSKQSMPDFLKASGQTEKQLRSDIAARIAWKKYISPQLSEQAVKKYYQENKIFFDKVMVRASHVLLRFPPNATQQDKQMLYNRLGQIRQEILAGKIPFDQAAKKYSDCPSKENGGDIGLFPRKFAVAEPFAAAAFSMKKGEISEVVTTEFGVHVIMVTDRTPGELSNYEALKDVVKETCANEYYQKIINDQRARAKIDITP